MHKYLPAPLASIGLVLSAACLPVSAEIATFRQGESGYTSGLDTSLYSVYPEHNFGGATDLFNLASGNVAAPQGQIFLKFGDVFGDGPGQIPLGATINSATVTLVSRIDLIGDGTIHKSFWSPMRIDVPNYGDNDGPADVGEASFRFRQQSQVGWGDANAGSTGPIRNEDFYGTGVTTQINYNSGPDASINFTSAGLTAIVQSWSSGTIPNYGFHLSPHGGANDNDLDNYGGTSTFFYSNEAANMNFHPLLTIDYTVAGALAGDFDDDGFYTPTDLDMLCAAIANAGPNDPYDVNEDTLVDFNDMTYEVETIIGTHFGDSDVDGDVDLSDLGNLATNYGMTSGASWAMGDFDCDADVDLNDLGSLATYYGQGSTQAFADFQTLTGVPEPSAAAAVILIGTLPTFRRRRSMGA